MHACISDHVDMSHVTPITIGNIFRKPDYKSKSNRFLTFKLENENENVNKHSSRSKNKFHSSERGCKLSKMQAGHTYFARDAPEIAIHSLFDRYDVEKNGKIDKAELKELFEGDLGLSPEQSYIYALMLDQAGEHNVTYEEFFNWLRSGERFENINDKSKFGKLCLAVEIFKTYDTDNSDTLDREQCGNLISSLGYHNVNSEKLFKELDSHHNGKLSFWEFMKWLNWVPLEEYDKKHE